MSRGVPDFATGAIIHDISRSYFREVQNEVPSGDLLDTNRPELLGPRDRNVFQNEVNRLGLSVELK
ncbi:MAG: hypothetical protein CMI18_03505 [Opitutaceae bacterium]|nr:hypothetical protein [Opitutaceae bacterium]